MVPITTDTSSQEASVGESERASSIQEAPPHENSNSKVDSGNFPFVESLGYEDPDFLGIEQLLEFGSFEDVSFFTWVKMDQFYDENGGATKDCKVSYLPRRLLKAETNVVCPKRLLHKLITATTMALETLAIDGIEAFKFGCILSFYILVNFIFCLYVFFFCFFISFLF
ncbi:F-box protein [Corchorus olitorius]|uniref:F-box protein n=1 Tax=Corchorus olitorius TaxID=93759 RepID=A0A1R3JQL0_9ROSI|nr:F-box protein [Corchorus olitorius]